MRWLLPVLAIVAIAFAPGTARAGDYHSSSTLICSDCHVAHFSVSHAYNEGDAAPVPLVPGGPHPRLLKAEGNDLCLTCHDGQNSAPDVFGANTGSGGNRLGGALNASATSLHPNDAGYTEIDGHSLWSTAPAPGGGTVPFANTTEGLSCSDCHSPHGSAAQYRNLRTSTSLTNKFYQKALTYATGTNVSTAAVYQRFARGYTEPDVDFNEPNQNESAYGNWCAACHPTFHGPGGDADMGSAPGGNAGRLFPWLRHPVADVNIGQNSASMKAQYAGRTNKVKVMDNTGAWGAVPDASVTATCFSCHKSHGNQNGFGLIYMSGTGTVTEEGDGGAYRDLCRQCHTQGA